MREGVTSSPGITSPRESFGLNALHICELLRATLKGFEGQWNENVR